MNRVAVVKPSANVDNGRCWANGTSLAEGDRRIDASSSSSRVGFGCREHDATGGDCHVRVRYYSRAEP